MHIAIHGQIKHSICLLGLNIILQVSKIFNLFGGFGGDFSLLTVHFLAEFNNFIRVNYYLNRPHKLIFRQLSLFFPFQNKCDYFFIILKLPYFDKIPYLPWKKQINNQTKTNQIIGFIIVWNYLFSPKTM